MITKEKAVRYRGRLVRARVRVRVSPGQMLRTLRELHGLTQLELARRSGMTQSNLSPLESGARNIGRERALALAKALRVHPAVILFPDYDVAAAA